MLEISSDDESTAANSMVDICYVASKESNEIGKNLSSINTIAFTNSSNIQIGDRIVYNGSVIINQDASNVNQSRLNTLDGVACNNSNSVEKSLINCNKKFVILFTIIAIVAITWFLLILWQSNKKVQKIDEIKTTPKPYDFKVLSRKEWGAYDYPIDPNNVLKLPMKKVIIAHTVQRNCYTKECCVSNLHMIQVLHKSYGWEDIGYNFVVCNDGLVYEGLGWDYEGAHTLGQNDKSIGIAFNGDYGKEIPNKNQISAVMLLFKEGVRLEKLTPDYKIYGARQFYASESPGDALYQLIQTWDRWSDEI